MLSGILILVAVGMFDWHAMRKAHVSPRGDVIVMFTTMIITVVVDLTIAVMVGIALSLLVHRLRSRQRKAKVTQDDTGTYRIDGPLSFLSVDGVFGSCATVVRTCRWTSSTSPTSTPLVPGPCCISSTTPRRTASR